MAWVGPLCHRFAMAVNEQTSPKGEPSAQDHGTTEGRDVLAHQLSALARELEAEDDPTAMLNHLTHAAVDLIPGAEDASISVVKGRSEVSSRHPTSDLPNRVDELQTRLREGPCLSAAFEEQTVRVIDMSTERRWPAFAPAVVDLGAMSMLSFQLYVEGDNLGALNLYGRRVGAFDDDSEHVGLLFASHAAVAIADAEKVRHLQMSVASRDILGRPKGFSWSASRSRAIRRSCC